MELQELVERSWAIRQAYHELEGKHHDSKWTVEEDLLALSNDIGNFQRLVMTKQGRYYDETPYTLEQKLSENIWWLLELSQRLDIDILTEMENFLSDKEKQLNVRTWK
ncbi:30S ribosomal protein S15 [Streptococcus pneumoniae]|nr:30S ribosomal protein S15 [Streptococcus pneumoniae]